VANADTFCVDEDTSLTMASPGVLGNDIHPEGKALTASVEVGPSHGTLALAPDGSITYTPTPNYSGPDSFTYRASGSPSSEPATVAITVSAVNDTPAAVADAYGVDRGTALAVAAPGLLSNDTDGDGDKLSAEALTVPAHGTLALASDGGLTYVPDANYLGPDSFTYRARDGPSASAPVTVTITVRRPPGEPLAVADAYSVDEDTPLAVAAPGVLTNDTDPEGDPLSASVVTATAHGTLVLSPNGSFTYTPAANYTGPDAFTYRVSDGTKTSDPATVSLTVNPMNDAPSAGPDNYSVDEDTVLTVAAPAVLANDSDPEGAPLTAEVVGSPAHGTLALSPNGSFTYTPAANYTGPDAFTYRVRDGPTASAPATVSLTVNPVNDAPTAVADTYGADEDTPLTVAAPGVLSNDTDPDGNPLTAAAVTNPAHGTLTLSTNGSFTYTPAAAYSGPDSFTYRVSDGTLTSAPATVSLTVNQMNDAPTAVADNYLVAKNSVLTVAAPGVLTNDSDPEGNVLSAEVVTTPTQGTLALAPNGSFTYTPAANYEGPDSFTYRTSDGTTTSEPATVSITVGAVAPDLRVTLADQLASDNDGDGQVTPGDTLGYRLEVTNAGAGPATNVNVVMSAPSETTLIPASVQVSPNAPVAATPGELSVSVGMLAAGQGTVVTLQARVQDFPSPGVSEIVATATATSAEGGSVPSDDPDTSDARDPTRTPLVLPDRPGPAIAELSPSEGTTVTEPVAIRAALSPQPGESLARWRVTGRRVGTDEVVELGSGVGPPPVNPGGGLPVLATFDPTVRVNGTWEIAVQAAGSGGGITTATTALVVEGNLKLGRYVTTYQDLSVPVAGIPIQVLRTYDSFDKSTGDFGVGWKLEVADFRVAVNKPLGQAGWSQKTGSCGLIFCDINYETSIPHFVTVTWPDGRQEVFDLDPADGSTVFRPLSRAAFKGRPATTSRLEPVGDDGLTFTGDGNLYGGFGGGEPYDPQQFRLVAKDGTAYLLDRTQGLLSATDRNGNTVTVTDDGITSSNGPGIAFRRDAQGRIDKITGPGDQTLTYRYEGRNLTSVADANGRATSFDYGPGGQLNAIDEPGAGPLRTLVYDADGRLQSITDPAGNATTVNVDVGARTELVTDPTGRLTTLTTFDSRGNPTRIVEAFDGRRVETVMRYNARDQVEARTDGLGRTWTIAYDDTGNLTSLTDPTGAKTELAYTDLGLPATSTDAEGHTTRYAYDAQGNLISVTDPAGKTETYDYQRGVPIKHTDRDGNVTAWSYDDAGKVKTVTDAEGGVRTFGYDDAERLASITDATNRSVQFGYDQVGNLRTVTDPAGKSTTFDYDERDRLVAETDPTRRTARYSYDEAGHLRRVTDPANQTTEYEADAAGRVTRVTDPTGVSELYGYDGAGRLSSVTDPAGKTTSLTRDDVGRLQQATDPLGNRTNWEYDVANRVARISLPSGPTSSFTYDRRGLLTSVTDGTNNTWTFEFDSRGRLQRSIDGRHFATTYGYDESGRSTAITDPKGGTVSFGYDRAGRRISVRDPLGVTRATRYDRAGRIEAEIDPLGRVFTYSYDVAGRLAERGDPRGVRLGLGYDDAGRLINVNTPEGPSTHGYDAAGRRDVMTDPTGTTRWAYDAAGRVSEVAAPQGSVGYGYENGRRSAMTLPGNRTVSYAYDEAGRLRRLTDWQSRSTTFAYRGDALAAINRPNGVDTTYNYDAAGRVEAIAHVGPQGLIDQFKYDYDASGNRIATDSNRGKESYTLDELNRLTKVTYPGGSTDEYSYDAVGNRRTETRSGGPTTTYSYNAAGQLTSDGTRSYRYDESGNLIEAGAARFQWDWANRLARADVDGTSSTYQYDGDGVRVGATTNGVSTPYVWDRLGPWETLVSDATNSYVHAGGTLAQLDGAGTPSYPLSDGLGSIRSLTGPTGAVIGTTDYTAFGDERGATGARSTFGFTGEQTDPNGLVYLRNRYLDPSVARFLSPDAVQPNAPGTQGYNRYGYVANNPTTWADPTGQSVFAEYSTLAEYQVKEWGPIVEKFGHCLNRILLIEGWSISSGTSPGVDLGRQIQVCILEFGSGLIGRPLNIFLSPEPKQAAEDFAKEVGKDIVKKVVGEFIEDALPGERHVDQILRSVVKTAADNTIDGASQDDLISSAVVPPADSGLPGTFMATGLRNAVSDQIRTGDIDWTGVVIDTTRPFAPVPDVRAIQRDEEEIAAQFGQGPGP
jgi:RHS repeat-associated protein/uncharacterized repeat protein (TIGR01451 family)